ncbi:MAG TPA: ThuA domain-containing protein [Planctomycetota bacterium]|nr:ThuA domain-containing protein [Planctomycetota bacterium]
MSLRVTLWFEDRQVSPRQREIYPGGMHAAIAAFLEREADIRCQCFTMDGPPLTEETLDQTDVLIWYGHLAHRAVDDRLVDLCWKRVLEGMGLVVPHSGHFSKLFIRLMGTTCQLSYRVDGGHERETIWVVNPAHLIAQGIGEGFIIPTEEVYREFHDIPQPEELVLISGFPGGEVFRSGCCWRRGAGRIFYFRPGHETCPTWHQPEVQRVMINAVRWAAPTGTMAFEAGPRGRDDFRQSVDPNRPRTANPSHPSCARLGNSF